jgi:LytS/YehU family sensor histidine kinase
MDHQTTLQLLHNLTLLLVLSIPHRFILRACVGRRRLAAFWMGLLFGSVCVIGMAIPIEFKEGLIFDSRSVFASVGTLFGGPITGILVLVIAGCYRAYLGGVGMWSGLGLIRIVNKSRDHLPLPAAASAAVG